MKQQDNIQAINDSQSQLKGPQVTVSPCGTSVRVVWADGMEESADIPEFSRAHVLQALENPAQQFGRDGMTNTDFALLLTGICNHV